MGKLRPCDDEFYHRKTVRRFSWIKQFASFHSQLWLLSRAFAG
jgi:hypothetical protein